LRANFGNVFNSTSAEMPISVGGHSNVNRTLCGVGFGVPVSGGQTEVASFISDLSQDRHKTNYRNAAILVNMGNGQSSY
jgi:hypothetical protein